MSDKVERFDYEFTGRIVDIQPTMTFNSGFKKRTIVIDNKDAGAEYPNPVPFSFTKDRCEDADKYRVGDVITVKGWFNGRKWHDDSKNVDKYFSDMTIGRVEAISAAGVAAPSGVASSSGQYAAGAGQVPAAAPEPMTDDLPF